MSFVRDTFTTLGSRVISVILGIGVASASAWLLGPEGRGALAIYIVFGTLLGLATSVGIEMAGAYYVGTKKYRLSEVVFSEILIITVATVLSIGVAYALWFGRPVFMEKFTYWGLLFGIAYVPMLLAFESFWYLHAALGNTASYCLGNILSVGLTLIGILLLCWKNGAAELAMFAYVIATFLASVFLLARLGSRHDRAKLILSWKCIKDMYIYGFKYCFARLAQFLNVQIGTIVIAFLGTIEDVGFFAVAIGLVAKLTILPEILIAVLLSRVVKGQQTSLELTTKAVRSVFWLILFASLVLALLCKPLVWIMFSPRFLAIVVPIWCLLPGMLVRCCSKTLGVYFNGIGCPGINSIAIICAVIVNVILMLVLLPKFSVTGAAMAATGGYLVDAVILLCYYKFWHNHSLLQLIPRINDIKDIAKLLLGRFSKPASMSRQA